MALAGRLAKIDDIVAYAQVLWVGAILLVSFGWHVGKHFWPPVVHLVYMLRLAADRFDAVLIATDHDAVDYAQLLTLDCPVVDTRNAMARRSMAMEAVTKVRDALPSNVDIPLKSPFLLIRVLVACSSAPSPVGVAC